MSNITNTQSISHEEEKYFTFFNDYSVTHNFMATLVSELSMKTCDFLSQDEGEEVTKKIKSLHNQKESLTKDKNSLIEALNKENDKDSKDINLQEIKEIFFKNIKDFAKKNEISIDNNQEILSKLKERLQTSNKTLETKKGKQIQTEQKERIEIKNCQTLKDIENVLLFGLNFNHYIRYNIFFQNFFLKAVGEEYESKPKKFKKEFEKSQDEEIELFFIENIKSFRVSYERYKKQEELKKNQKLVTLKDTNEKEILEKKITEKQKEILEKEKEINELEKHLEPRLYNLEQKKIIFCELYKSLNLSAEHFNSLKNKNFLELSITLDMDKILAKKDSRTMKQRDKVYNNHYRKNILEKFVRRKQISEFYNKITANINLDKNIFDQKYSKEIKQKILFLTSSFTIPLFFFVNRIGNFHEIDIKNNDFREYFAYLLDKEYKEILNEKSTRNSFQENDLNFLEISNKFSFLKNNLFIYKKNNLINQVNYFNITGRCIKSIQNIKNFYLTVKLENLSENSDETFLNLIKNDDNFIKKINGIGKFNLIFRNLNQNLHEKFLNLIAYENHFIEKINKIKYLSLIFRNLNENLHEKFLNLIVYEDHFIEKINKIKYSYSNLRDLNQNLHEKFLNLIIKNENNFIEKIHKIKNFDFILEYLNENLHEKFLNLIIKNENNFIEKINKIKDFYYILADLTGENSHEKFLHSILNDNNFVEKINKIKNIDFILENLKEDLEEKFLNLMINDYNFIEKINKVEFHLILKFLKSTLQEDFLNLIIKNENYFIDKINNIKFFFSILENLKEDSHEKFLNLILSDNNFIKKISEIEYFYAIFKYLNKDLHEKFLNLIVNDYNFIEKTNKINYFCLKIRYLNQDLHSDFLKILQDDNGFIEFKENSPSLECNYYCNPEDKIKKFNDYIKNLSEKYFKKKPSHELTDQNVSDASNIEYFINI